MTAEEEKAKKQHFPVVGLLLGFRLPAIRYQQPTQAIGRTRVTIYLAKTEKAGSRGGKRTTKHLEGWVVSAAERGYFFLSLCCFFAFLCCSLRGSASCYDADRPLGLGTTGHL